MSSGNSNGELYLPPGFRFHPTDEELVKHYLCRKCAAMPIFVPNLIADINLYKYDPWQLPGLAMYGEKEWYFFSPRDRKYPNGTRPNRAAASGYWKATGADKPIGAPKPMAIKKALVFYGGKAPKGDKTNWIMHEYRLADTDRSVHKKNNLRLDDWVLCRIYNKKGSTEKNTKLAGSKNIRPAPTATDEKQSIRTSHVTNPVSSTLDMVHHDTSDWMPRESSCSEHVMSPEFTCDREVQSQHRWNEWDKALNVPINYGGDTGNFMEFGSGLLEPGSRDPIQDILMFLQKPF